MLKRVVITLRDDEFDALIKKSDEFGFSASQMAKYVLLGELNLPQKNAIPQQTLRKELEDYVTKKKKGATFYVSSPFGERWWDFDTGTKRALAWHLKSLEDKKLCKKTGRQLPNGTHQYHRI